MSDLTVSYAPLMGMVVAVDGSITYNFDGRVHAHGLDLDAAPNLSAIQADDRARWLSAGVPVADVVAAATPPGMSLAAYADGNYGETSGALADIDLLTGGTPTGLPAALLTMRGPVGPPLAMTLLDSHGNSEFIQTQGLPGPSVTTVGGALISAAGAVTSSEGGLASVGHPSTGRYDYTFANPAAARYLLPIAVTSGGAIGCDLLNGGSATVLTAFFYTVSPVALVDIAHELLWLERLV